MIENVMGWKETEGYVINKDKPVGMKLGQRPGAQTRAYVSGANETKKTNIKKMNFPDSSRVEATKFFLAIT